MAEFILSGQMEGTENVESTERDRNQYHCLQDFTLTEGFLGCIPSASTLRDYKGVIDRNCDPNDEFLKVQFGTCEKLKTETAVVVAEFKKLHPEYFSKLSTQAGKAVKGFGIVALLALGGYGAYKALKKK